MLCPLAAVYGSAIPLDDLELLALELGVDVQVKRGSADAAASILTRRYTLAIVETSEAAVGWGCSTFQGCDTHLACALGWCRKTGPRGRRARPW